MERLWPLWRPAAREPHRGRPGEKGNGIAGSAVLKTSRGMTAEPVAAADSGNTREHKRGRHDFRDTNPHPRAADARAAWPRGDRPSCSERAGLRAQGRDRASARMASRRRRHEDHAGTASELMACGLDAFAWTMVASALCSKSASSRSGGPRAANNNTMDFSSINASFGSTIPRGRRHRSRRRVYSFKG
jgi:hypothetical protein